MSKEIENNIKNIKDIINSSFNLSDINREFNDTAKSILIENKYINAIVIIFLITFGSLFAHKLPKNILEFLNGPLIRILMCVGFLVLVKMKNYSMAFAGVLLMFSLFKAF